MNAVGGQAGHAGSLILALCDEAGAIDGGKPGGSNGTIWGTKDGAAGGAVAPENPAGMTGMAGMPEKSGISGIAGSAGGESGIPGVCFGTIATESLGS
jgi:hypothetical protein